MELFLAPLFWLVDLFSLQSSDPVLRTRKRAKFLACVFGCAAIGLALLCASLNTDIAVGSTSFLAGLTNSVRAVATLVVLGATLLSASVALWNVWIYYRTHTRPDLFFS